MLAVFSVLGALGIAAVAAWCTHEVRRRRAISRPRPSPATVPVWETWRDSPGVDVLTIQPARSDYRVTPPTRWHRESRNVSDGNNS